MKTIYNKYSFVHLLSQWVVEETTSCQRLEKGIVTGCTSSSLSSTFRNGHESNHQRHQEGNQRTKDSLGDTPTIQQRVHGWPDHINYNSCSGPLGSYSIR